MSDETENAQEEDKPLSENAKKLVDLIVRIIVSVTLWEVGMENEIKPFRAKSLVKKSKWGSNKRK